MVENELKQNIARNITALRKQHNMTQAELAEHLSYSDKSISKWERGDGLPDVFVLTKIAELFGVTVNDIIGSEPAHVEPAPLPDTARPRRFLITALSTGLVWFVATLVFFLLNVFLPGSNWLWISFIYALPVSAIVLVVFTHLWWGNVQRCLSVSLLVWMLTLSVYLTAVFANDVQNMALIYVAAGVFQVLVILWYVYRHMRKKYARGGATVSLTPAEQADSPADETQDTDESVE
ncbi:MAG: helix-turn-helix transcriptional regulator [Clostridia bacterium]|nr:helix-turn-helix transcriptional regulator [Clostridia bacterium]